MEKIQNYLSTNPVWAGVLIIAFGVFLLLASVFDWHIVFGDVNTSSYNPVKIDGMINLFGRKATRFICAIVSIAVIAGGFLWIWASLHKQ